MKHFHLFIILLTSVILGCTPEPKIKITEGKSELKVLSEEIKQVQEETPLDFNLEAPVAPSTPTPAGTAQLATPKNPNPSPQIYTATQFGTLSCKKIQLPEGEKLNCRYTPRKYFFGQDRALFLTKNLKKKDALLSIIFKVTNIYSRPVAYDASFEAKAGASKIEFQLPEAYEPDYPQEKDNGLDYADFKNGSTGTLKCERRNCSYDLKTSIDSKLVLTFTYRAVEKLRGETESPLATITLTFQKSVPVSVPDIASPPSISDITISQANFSKEVSIPFRALASNEALELTSSPLKGEIASVGSAKIYRLSKLDFAVTDDSFTYRIKRSDNGNVIYSATKKVSIHIPSPKSPTLITSEISFDPKKDTIFKSGVFNSYPSFVLLNKFNYETNLPYTIKIEPAFAALGSFNCNAPTNDRCTYTLKSSPTKDGEDLLNFWMVSGDPLVKTQSSLKGQLRVKYYAPTAVEVDDIVVDPHKYILNYAPIALKNYMRGVDDYNKITLKFKNSSAYSRLNCTNLICAITPPLRPETGFQKEVIDFEIHYQAGSQDLVTTRTITLLFYAPKGPVGNPPSNAIATSIPSGAKSVLAVRLIGSDEDSLASQVEYSSFTPNADSASKVEIKNCRKENFNLLCDIWSKTDYVIKPNDSASFTYYLKDETNLKSVTQTLNIALSPPPPVVALLGTGVVFKCYAVLGATTCSNKLPVPTNSSLLGNYTYRIKPLNAQQSLLGQVSIDSPKNGMATVVLNSNQAGQREKTVSFDYEIVSEAGAISTQKGYAYFKFKTALTNKAPVLGLNNITLAPNALSETRTINVSDEDSYDQDLRIYFDLDKTKNKTIVNNSNGHSLQIVCGGEKGDINPTQCKFTLLNPPLKSVSETFSVGVMARDIFLEGGVDTGKSSEKGALNVTLTRDLLAMEAKNTLCTFVINQKTASCEIDGLTLYESKSEDVKVLLTNAASNGNDLIQCEKRLEGQNLKIVCSLNLGGEITSYPLRKDFFADFNIANTSNSSLSMKGAKRITFSFSREPKIYTKKQTFSTSSTAQIPGVDILWVVDNTFTMGPHQESLSANFQSFINTFVPVKDGTRSAPYPFKMAAITTDAYLQKDAATGNLCAFIKCSDNSNPILVNDGLAKSNFDLFKQNFDSIIKVGTTGNPVEKTLESMLTFMNKNSNWSNSNNLLVLIFISDELEQSYQTGNCPLPESKNPLKLSSGSAFTPACATERAQWSIDQIKKLKSRKDLIKVFSVIDTKEDHGNTYQAISKEFSGISQSLSASFTSLLSQIGTSITDTFLEYNLSFQGTFYGVKAIKIDGVILPNINNQNYEFMAPNKIKLKTPPGEGKTMEVEFDYTNND